jgi:hypothetical protein
MKKAEQHSVLSCDSCERAEKTNSQTYPFKCRVSKPVPMMVHEYCVGWFGYVGCASHSSAVPASNDPLSKENLSISAVCGYEAGLKEGAKQERERTVDDIMRYLAEHGVEKRPEGYFVVSGTFSLGGFIKHLESLRGGES